MDIEMNEVWILYLRVLNVVVFYVFELYKENEIRVLWEWYDKYSIKVVKERVFIFRDGKLVKNLG